MYLAFNSGARSWKPAPDIQTTDTETMIILNCFVNSGKERG